MVVREQLKNELITRKANSLSIHQIHQIRGFSATPCATLSANLAEKQYILEGIEDAHFFTSLLEDRGLADCLLVHPVFDEQDRHPLAYETIHYYQGRDAALQQAVQINNAKWQKRMFGNDELIVYIPDKNKQPHNWRIAIPTDMLDHLVQWYHVSLNHVGMTLLENTIKQIFFHPQLRESIERLVGQCDACQRLKTGSRQYGELPARDVLVAPWHDVHLDLIGPWKMTVHGVDLYFNALTAIDPVTNLVEIYRLQEKTAYFTSLTFENGWLSRYPRPMRCIHDDGAEFKGAFITMLQHNNIKNVKTTVKNPQSNAICERMHLTVGNVLRTLMHVNPPQDMLQASDLIDTALATTMHAVRTSASHALDYFSPGAAVFHRNMYFDVPLITDIMAISQPQRREAIVNESL